MFDGELKKEKRIVRDDMQTSPTDVFHKLTISGIMLGTYDRAKRAASAIRSLSINNFAHSSTLPCKKRETKAILLRPAFFACSVSDCILSRFPDDLLSRRKSVKHKTKTKMTCM